MLTEEAVIVTAPQVLDAIPETVIPGMASIADPDADVGAGTLFVSLMRSRSPGRTCSVGDSAPLAVMKQNNVLPNWSTLVSYVKLTRSTPCSLKRSWGCAIELPTGKRGQGAEP